MDGEKKDANLINKRSILLGGATVVAASALLQNVGAQTSSFGDYIGITNLSCYSFGMMGYKTPNIDRIATEGLKFTDYYSEQNCNAGHAAFITGQGGFCNFPSTPPTRRSPGE